MQVFWRRRAHPSTKAGGQDDGCESGPHTGLGWGARIRTWDRGTKTRCLTTWLRPRAFRTLFYRRSPKTKKRPIRAKTTAAMIAVQKTMNARMTASTASSCDAAKIQDTCRIESERAFRPA